MITIALASLMFLGATDCNRSGHRCAGKRNGRTARIVTSASTTPATPFFEFAPSDGTGMGTVCACTTPTSKGGDTMTFTRATPAYCTKTATGGGLTGIATGDLVLCGVNQPVVTTGSDGSGVLGLQVTAQVSNYSFYSQQFDNGYYLKLSGGGSSAPVVTANFALSPANDMTAERVQLGATSGLSQYSIVYGGGCALGTNSAGFYVKGNGTSGTTDMGILTDTAWENATCTYNATTWTRCIKENVFRAGPTVTYIGNGSANTDGTARAAQDILLWQGDCQPGSKIGPPVLTLGAADAMGEEVATFTKTFTGGTWALNVKWMTPPGGFSTAINSESNYPLSVYFDAQNIFKMYAKQAGATSKLVGDFFAVNTSAAAETAASMTAGTTVNAAMYYNGTEVATCLAGTCATGSVVIVGFPTGSATIYIGGSHEAGHEANGIIKNVKIDPVYP